MTSPSTTDEEEWSFRSEDWHLVTLTWAGPATRCCVAGEFCGWTEESWLEMTGNENGVHSVKVRLLEGCYQYKFVVDGQWRRDLTNPFYEQTFQNSLLLVGTDPREEASTSLTKTCPIPRREYKRPGEDGSEFCILSPTDMPLPDELAAAGVQPRPIFVYLPVGYHANQNLRYPVLYALDGQNVWSTPGGVDGPKHGGWWLDSQLDVLVQDNATCSFIIVAIPNGDAVSVYPLRKREYCPRRYDSVVTEPFVKYLVSVVKKTVDEKFRTHTDAEHTTILGASMAGLLSLALLLKAPNIFGKAIAMSPSLWFYDSENTSIYDVVRQTFFVEKDFSHCRKLFLHVADGAGDNSYETREMGKLLREVGEGFVEGVDFRFDYDEGRKEHCEAMNTHTEAVWRHRLHHALRFLFPPTSAS